MQTDFTYMDSCLEFKETLKTKDGIDVKVYEVKKCTDAKVLKSWSQHIRRHYCDDSILESLCKAHNLSRKDFLKQFKLPNREKPGPGVRAGELAEILVMDFLEFVLGFEVPRTRYKNKFNKNEPIKGSDVVGFKYAKAGFESPKDQLLVFESKAQLSKNTAPSNRLQAAIDDSVKDFKRVGITMSAYFQKFLEEKDDINANKVKRFLNRVDSPYELEFGAAASHCNSNYNRSFVATCEIGKNSGSKPILIVFKGDEFMLLAHELYDRAANEA